jgi:uncharacterized protein
MNDFIDKSYTYAIVGASNDASKFGYRVLKDMKGSGYDVIPINPKEKEILGLKVFTSVKSLEKIVDVAVFIVPPTVSEKVLEDVKAAGIRKVWFQPGSESKRALDFCKENKIACVYHMCIMVERLSYD